MLLHRIGQRRAAFDVAARLQNDARRSSCPLPGAENLEALHERQAGVDHHRELPREDREVLGRRRPWRLAFFGAAAALTCARRDRVTRICSRRSADTTASMVSPTRSPLIGFAAARASGECKCRHDCPRYLMRRTTACGGRAGPAQPAPGTTPTPRLIISCSSSRCDDAPIAVVERDQPLEVQRRQRLVHRLHPGLFLAGLHRRIDLVNLVFANQVADARRRAPGFRARRTRPWPFGLRQQRLTDDAFEHERQLRANLRLLMRRETRR